MTTCRHCHEEIVKLTNIHPPPAIWIHTRTHILGCLTHAEPEEELR